MSIAYYYNYMCRKLTPGSVQSEENLAVSFYNPFEDPREAGKMRAQQLPLRTNRNDRQAYLFTLPQIDQPFPGTDGTETSYMIQDCTDQITAMDTFLIQRQSVPANDLYFINKSIAVPFKWEVEPGRAKLQVDISPSLYPLQPPPGKTKMHNSAITLTPSPSWHRLVHTKLKDAVMGKLRETMEKYSYNYSSLTAHYTAREEEKFMGTPSNLFSCFRPAKAISLGKVSLCARSETLIKRMPAGLYIWYKTTAGRACNENTQQSRGIHIQSAQAERGCSSPSVKLQRYGDRSEWGALSRWKVKMKGFL
eukprot:c34262_g1_i1 orf=80-1000(-)